MSFFSYIHRLFSSNSAAVIDQADTVVAKIVGLVQEAETMFPHGADKLEHVKRGLQIVWDDFKAIEASFEQAWPAISALISTLVGLYNTAGAFKHAAK